jgi:S1-C subfamily serine protease
MGMRKRLLLAAIVGVCCVPAIRADEKTKPAEEQSAKKSKVPEARLKEIFAGKAPTSIDELRAMETRQRELVDKVIEYTVGLRVGPAHGSGVVISKDGFVLTAAHVAMQPGAHVIITFPNGKRARGRSLGTNKRNDAGMIKINETKDAEGNLVEWPHAEMGLASSVKRGQWCFAAGHPGGFNPKRNLVVRVGRILGLNKNVLISDCSLIGGDSGGPLFDMAGAVIGIHSRIGQSLTANLHVPINAFADDWDKLAAAESWGSRLGGGPAQKPSIGVQVGLADDSALIRGVTAGGPADKAGIKPNDIVTHINDQPISDPSDLIATIGKHKVGGKVKIKVQRDGKEVVIDLVIGHRR